MTCPSHLVQWLEEPKPREVLQVTEIRELTRLIGTKFIQRRDVKAVQSKKGEWFTDGRYVNHQRVEEYPFKMADFEAHFGGHKTYGHYLLDQEGKCKFWAYDIDLIKKPIDLPELVAVDGEGINGCKRTGEVFRSLNPREAWNTPDHPARDTLAIQLFAVAEGLAWASYEEIGESIHVVIEYSGYKGFHVYCLRNDGQSLDASDAKAAGQAILEDLGTWSPVKGDVFWSNLAFPAIEVEVFPKQDSISEKGYGNLMAIPYGVHQISGAERYFITTKTYRMDRWNPVKDPVALLAENVQPWEQEA